MNHQDQLIVSRHSEGSGASLRAYVSGFVLSISFTLAAYLLVVNHTYSYWSIIITIAALAFVQFLTQLYFFLHLGHETRPRWKLLALGFMMMVVGILVVGSLWIMSNLNYHMSMQQINSYMQNQEDSAL